jgi:hypothetical protein
MAAFPATVVHRYTTRILDIHRDLSVVRLMDAVDGEPLFAESSPEGLITLTVKGDQLPERYLWALYGFRLEQYLQRGWVDQGILCERALSCEPYGPEARDDYHTVVLERRTGLIRGYGTLAATRDRTPTALSSRPRRPFVVERDYGLDLAENLGPGTLSSQVWEGKRLIRDYDLGRSQAAVSVPWWVYLGWAVVCQHLLADRGARAIVGDAKKEGAIHQLHLLGFEVEMLDRASRPPDTGDLFGPLWDQAERSQPFILRNGPRLRPTLRALDQILMSGGTGSIRRQLEKLATEMSLDRL